MKTGYKSTYKIKGRLLSLLLAAVMVMGMLITGIPPMKVYADAGVPGMPPINLAFCTDYCSEPISMSLSVSGGMGTVSNFGGAQPTTIASVDSYEEFIDAIEDTDYTTIDIIGDFALEDNVTINREVTITSANGSIISAGTHCLLVSGTADVTMTGNLTVTGGTVVSVGADSKFTLNGGTISADGDNSRGIFVQPKGVAYINGGSVSASGGDAYGILLGWGDGMADLYIDMSNTPSIDDVYFVDFEGIAIVSYLTSFPAPFTAEFGETKTVALTGVGSGADLQVHRIGADPPPGTSEALNAHEESDNIFTITPNAFGTYRLVISGTTARSNIFITIPVTVSSGFAGGVGSAGDPFQIANIEQLNLVRKFLGSANTDKHFRLTENIDLNVAPYNAGEGWEPIGNNDAMFQGNFDGNGKTISGLFINQTDSSPVGLFGACSDANIQNLCLTGVNISGNGDAGSLAVNLYEASAVTNCYATGTVSGGDTTGGLVGTMSDSTVIESSYAMCSVTGNTAGGLVGGMGGTSSITDAYAIGPVTGSNAGGGLVGSMLVTSSITNSYAIGMVTGTHTGGLVGEKSDGGVVTASYYNSQISGQSDDDGRGKPKTSSQLVKKETFNGWNFTQGTGEWDISEGVSYPYLQALVPNTLPAPPAPTGITAAPENLTLTYGDTGTLTPSVEGPAGVLIPDITWTSNDPGVATVSDGVVTAVGVGDTTIIASIAGGMISDTVTVNVNKKPLTITGGSVEAKTYDGTTAAHVTALNFDGLINSESLTIITDYTVSSTHFDSADAGTDKTVTGTVELVSTGTTAKNYTLTDTGLSLTGQTIGKATFTVPNVDKFVMYTDTNDQTVDIAVLVADKMLSGDTLAYQAGDATGPNAGIIQSKLTNALGTLTFTVIGGTTGDTATIPVTVSGFTNYNDVTVNVVVTLTDKIPVTVNLPAPDKTYDGNPAAASANANGIPGEDFTYTWFDSNGTQLTDNTPPENAGIYQVKAKISGNSANVYIGEATVSFTIAKKTVTVRADDKSVTRAGVLPAPTVSYSGFVGTDSAANALAVQAEARLNVTDSSTVGTSVIDFVTQAVLNNTIGANYTLSHVNGTLTIRSSSGGSPSGKGGSTPANNNLEIPASFVSNPKSEKTLTLGNDFASVTIPADMLDYIPDIVGKKAEIFISQGDKSGLPDDVKAAIGNRPLISLSLLLDGKRTEWSNPDAPVAVSIPYTPTADELKNPDSIIIWYIDGSGNTQCVTNGHYDPVTGTVKFDVTHFSDYAVVYNPVSFNDVKSGAWYYKAVSFIAARDITRGTGGGNFSPGSKLTRGDFLVMLMKAYGIAPDTSPADNFSDAGNTYYTGYLAAAKRLGISAGVGNNMYAPGKEITRQEMFTLLYNALKVIGKLPGTHGRATALDSDQPISEAGDQPGTHGRAVSEADDQPKGNSGNTLSDFTDADDIAPWAKEAMTLFVKTNTIGGSGGKLNPTITTTRAEMAQVLYNLLSK